VAVPADELPPTNSRRRTPAEGPAAARRGPALSCDGNQAITTPNLDRLAAEGVRYTRAYTTPPVCSASRSAFMTGMYQTTIGAQNHRSHRGESFSLPDGVKVVPERLNEAGYFCTNLTTLPESFGFQGTGKTDWNFDPPETGFQTGRWEDLPARGRAGSIPPRFGDGFLPGR